MKKIFKYNKGSYSNMSYEERQEIINYIMNNKLIYHITNFLDYEFNKVFSENSDWLNVKLEISDITNKYKSKFWVLQVDIIGCIISGFKINNTFEIIIYINNGVIEINRFK